MMSSETLGEDRKLDIGKNVLYIVRKRLWASCIVAVNYGAVSGSSGSATE